MIRSHLATRGWYYGKHGRRHTSKAHKWYDLLMDYIHCQYGWKIFRFNILFGSLYNIVIIVCVLLQWSIVHVNNCISQHLTFTILLDLNCSIPVLQISKDHYPTQKYDLESSSRSYAHVLGYARKSNGLGLFPSSQYCLSRVHLEWARWGYQMTLIPQIAPHKYVIKPSMVAECQICTFCMQLCGVSQYIKIR